MAKNRNKTILPRHTGRYAFVLTPLADAMFQLLIFFMLSSNLAPYTLLTLRSGTDGTEAGADGQEFQEEINAPPPNAAIWTLGEGEIVAQGQRIAPDQLAPLAQALAANADAAVVLIVREEARVQDLSDVLEALTAAGVNQVQIAESGGA